MSKPVLRILSNLARSGGTLVSRCIASMDGIALLSEIHPVGSLVSDINILNQAMDWYQLFKSGELQPDRDYTFAEIIRLIAREIEDKGLQLVIRDWAHLDFMALPYIDRPYYRSRLVEQLEKDFDIIQFHLFRHPVPQWFSTDSVPIIHGKLSLEQYLEGYFHFACSCTDNGFVRYEDFSIQPEVQMQRICGHLHINYDPGFIDKWSGYTKITGELFGEERRPKFSYIKPVTLPKVSAEFHQRLQRCEYYHKSIQLLGYEDVEVG